MPDRYAVIGHPVAHSLSPRIHAAFARQTGQSLVYDAIDLEPEALAAGVRRFFEAGGRGLNVTVPHKRAALALVQRLSPRARRAQAINTILSAGPELTGDNTDGVGLVRDLQHNLGLQITGRRLLLLGAGGAARGILGPLLELVPSEIVIANRTLATAQELARAFADQGTVRAVPLGGCGTGFDLVLNATAASLHDEVPPLPSGTLGPATVCYDLAYGRQDTRFVRYALAQGVPQAHMGLGMLVEQAAEAFFLWRGTRPETADILAELRVA